MPDDILDDNYEEIKETIRAFGHSKQEWDDYARKIDPVLRKTMERCFDECRKNGFFGPYIGSDGDLKFAQTVEPTRTKKEVYRVEERMEDGTVAIKRCGKEWLRTNMKIIERIKQRTPTARLQGD